MKIVEKKGIKHYVSGDIVHSVEPCTAYFGLQYWSAMIPPFKPENVLILGYGAGTIAGLIRKVYGGDDIEITGVDNVRISAGDKYANHVVNDDVYEYLRNVNQDKKFDYIVVDIFDGLTFNDAVPDAIFEEDVLGVLKAITGRMIAFNTPKSEFKDVHHIITDYFQGYEQKLVADNRVLFYIHHKAERMYDLFEIYNS